MIRRGSRCVSRDTPRTRGWNQCRRVTTKQYIYTRYYIREYHFLPVLHGLIIPCTAVCIRCQAGIEVYSQSNAPFLLGFHKVTHFDFGSSFSSENFLVTLPTWLHLLFSVYSGLCYGPKPRRIFLVCECHHRFLPFEPIQTGHNCVLRARAGRYARFM